jgi:hypothetical protein
MFHKYVTVIMNVTIFFCFVNLIASFRYLPDDLAMSYRLVRSDTTDLEYKS